MERNQKIIVLWLMIICGLFCMLTDCRAKLLRMVNAVLAVLIGLFNLAHAFMELPSENAGQVGKSNSAPQ